MLNANPLNNGFSLLSSGIYAKLNPLVGKACMVSGLVVGGTPIGDQWMNVQVAGSGFVGIIAGYAIAFAANGAVTVNYYNPLNPPTMIPASNGTYTLKGTKSSTGFTYDWVKDT